MNNKISLKLGARKSVLQVISVSVSSGKHDKRIDAKERSDTKAFEVLQEAGFGELKYEANRTKAFPPKGGNTVFLLDYDASNPANQKSCKIVCMDTRACKEIDTGYTIYISEQIDPTNPIEVYLRGDLLADWEVVCKVADDKTVEVYKMIVGHNNILKPKDPIPRSMRREREEMRTAPPEEQKREEEVIGPLPSPPARTVIQVIRATPPPTPQTIVPTTPLKVSAPYPSNGISGEVVLQIPLDECVCFQKQESDPSFSGQPRTHFDEIKLQKLAKSIKNKGQKVPALVRRIYTIPGKKWEIIAGERRWRALQMNGFPYLRAIEEKPENKKEQHLLALIENLFRVDPSPLEYSNALQQQIEAGETQASLADATSLSIGSIKNLLAVQSVCSKLKPFLGPTVPSESRIRLVEAAVLGKIHPDHQEEIWNQAKDQPTHRLIVAKIHELGKPFFQYKRNTSNDRRNHASEVAERLKRRLNTLSLALIELKAVTPEEWRQFIILRGTEKSSVETARLTEIISGIGEVKQKISRAKVTVRSETLVAPSKL